jgi:hypothetical protein
MSSSLKARVKRVALQVGASVVHGTPLHCGPCDYRWTGTDAECEELGLLSERMAAYIDQIPFSGRLCRCGSKLWCSQCYATAAQQIVVPADLFTPEEQARYFELLVHMEFTTPRPPRLKKEPA